MKSRKILIVATSFACGIALASLNETLKIIVLASMILFVALFLFFVFKQRAVAILVCVCVAVGFGVFSANMAVFHSADVNQKQVQVVGTLTDTECLLRDCTVDGKKVKGQINFASAQYYPGKDNLVLKPGMTLSFTCVLQDYFPDKDGIYTPQYKENYRYFTKEILTKITIENQGTPQLDEKARIYAKDMLSHYLSADAFGVAYAMVVGDTDYIDDTTLEAFRKVGIAHVFAVSGLHVGFVVMLVNAFVKKRKKLALAVTMAVVFLYAYICNFAPSIVRAMVMTFLLLFAKTLGREPDFLSAVATAVVAIFLIKPLYLFDAGFQMSVGAVLGIDFVTRVIERGITPKNGVVKKLVSSFAVSIGATLGTLPFMLQYFGKVSIIGLVANVVIIPVVSLVFMAILICLVLPVLFWAFPVIGKVIAFVTEATFLFEIVPNLAMASFNFGVIAYFILLYLLSGHCRFGLFSKSVFAVMMVLLVCVMTLLPGFETKDTKVSFFDSTGDTFCVRVDGQNYIFSQLEYNDDLNAVLSLCNDKTTLFVTDFEQFNSQLAITLSQHTNLKIRVLSFVDYFDEDYVLLNKNNIDVKVIKNYNDEKVEISSFEYLGKNLATVVNFKGCSFAYVGKLTDFQKGYLLQNMQPCDSYFSTNAFNEIKWQYPDSIVATKNYTDNNDIYTVYRCGNFTISLRGDKMVFAK